MRTTISIICCIPVLIFSWAPIPRHPITYGSISLVLTTIIQFYVALPIYSSALRSLLFLHMIDMDLLVAVSTSIAYIYSVVVFAIQAAGRKFSDQFFETSALLVTLIMLGRLVSAYAHRRASSALDDLAALQPRERYHCAPLRGCEPSTSTISEELVHTGDVLRILPDTLVPTDGIVLVGSSEVDESSITGESIPVTKQPGSSLIAGTLNLSGALDMQITRVPAESTLADIAKLLRDAQEAAAALPVRDLADRAAAHLAPVVFVLSIATFVIWMLVGVYVRHDTERTPQLLPSNMQLL
jgi:cation transport ATPase